MKLSIEGDLRDSSEDRSVRIKTILGIEDHSQFCKIYGQHLNIEMRLLHIIVCCIVQPIAEGFDIITKRDLAIMYHVVQCIPLNLSRMIIRAMQEVVDRAETFLPYAMILTHIFKYFGIRL